MYCSNCGSKNAPGSKFCINCGKKLSTVNHNGKENGAVASVLYAGFGQRLLASIIDAVIISLVNGSLNTLFEEISSLPAITSVKFIILLSIDLTYHTYFIGKKGQTPGKMAMDIQVVSTETKNPPGYLMAFIREYPAKILSTILLFFGYLWVLWDPNKQALHDKIARTIVIRKI